MSAAPRVRAHIARPHAESEVRTHSRLNDSIDVVLYLLGGVKYMIICLPCMLGFPSTWPFSPTSF